MDENKEIEENNEKDVEKNNENHKIKEKKRKSIICRVLLIIILVLLFVFVAVAVRKIVIIKILQGKLEPYKYATNYHYRVINEGEESELEYYDLYVKDNVSKSVMKPKIVGAKMTQFQYANKTKIYMDTEDGQHILNEYESDEQVVIVPFGTHYLMDENNLRDTLLYALLSKIESKKIDGKEYYIISGMNNSSFMYDDNATDMEIYINKETGFAEKIINYFEDDSKQVVHYETEYNTVTDEDMKEPDASGYTVK